MRIIALFVPVLFAAMFSGCREYDDTGIRNDIKELQQRVQTLEQWCQTAGVQIQTLQGLVEAVERGRFITEIVPVMEGSAEVGYRITFDDGDAITIRHGERGESGATPMIGVAQDPENPADERYYWTVKIGEGVPGFILDAQGNKIPVTGQKGEDGTPGHTPVVSVGDFGGELYWKVDGEWLLSGGNKVPARGERGDAIFRENGVDTDSDPDNVIFTLADGSTLTLPRTRALTVGFDSYETFFVTRTSNRIAVQLPATLKAEDYTALIAEIKNGYGTGIDIQTRTVADPWQVAISRPTFSGGVCQNDAAVTITVPAGIQSGDKAILKVTLIDKKGREVSASRPLEYFDQIEASVSSAGQLSTLLAAEPEVKSLKVVGPVNSSDLSYIGSNYIISSSDHVMEKLDLSEALFTTLPRYTLSRDDNNNTTLSVLVLPEGLQRIEQYALAQMKGLASVNIPSTVNYIGMRAFANTNIGSLELPEGLAELPSQCVYGCKQLVSIAIPASVTVIGETVFWNTSVTELTVSGAVTSIGKSAFYYMRQLASLTINAAELTEIPDDMCGQNGKLADFTLLNPDKLTKIGQSAFAGCPLKKIELPATLTEIYSNSFSWYNAASVTCRAVTPPTVIKGTGTAGAFINAGNCTLSVPAQSLEAYKNSEAWSHFKEIVAIP